jgi:hemerythrin-like domain-containing protein
MGPTEALVKEHEEIRVMLQVVSLMCRALEAGRAVSADHVEQAIEFIQGYADRYHHAKEEDLLFPAMERAGIPRDSGPVAVMLAEHDEGRAMVREAAGALGRYRQGDHAARMLIAANLRNFAGMLDSHIEKENVVLYPLADRQLTSADQEELAVGFERANSEGDSPQRYQRLQEILSELRGLYLIEE